MNKRNEQLPDTKDRILDAAEELFADNGITGTSLRVVTRTAGVNLAAIHYHFGSKERLCQEVFARRIGPVNRERLRRLDEVEATTTAAPTVEAVVRAFLDPVLQLKRDLQSRQEILLRLIGRFYTEPAELVQAIVREQFETTGRRFVGALVQALPHVPPKVVYERFQYMVAILSHLHTSLADIEVLPEYGGARPADEVVFDRLCAFVIGGLCAPHPAEPGDESAR